MHHSHLLYVAKGELFGVKTINNFKYLFSDVMYCTVVYHLILFKH